MASAGGKEEVALQKPTSRGTSILKIALNVCFYVASLAWIAYSTFKLIEASRVPWPNNSRWMLYWCFHSTLVGFITYKALIVDLKLADRYFFKKNHLVPIFISFAITAPLASLPFVIPGISGESRYNSGIFLPFTFSLICGGQLYWLLLPIQAAITALGKRRFTLDMGYLVFFASVLNIATFVVLMFVLTVLHVLL